MTDAAPCQGELLHGFGPQIHRKSATSIPVPWTEWMGTERRAQNPNSANVVRRNGTFTLPYYAQAEAYPDARTHMLKAVRWSSRRPSKRLDLPHCGGWGDIQVRRQMAPARRSTQQHHGLAIIRRPGSLTVMWRPMPNGPAKQFPDRGEWESPRAVGRGGRISVGRRVTTGGKHRANTWQAISRTRTLCPTGSNAPHLSPRSPPMDYGLHDMIVQCLGRDADWYSSKHDDDGRGCDSAKSSAADRRAESYYDRRSGDRIPRKVRAAHICARPNSVVAIRPDRASCGAIDTSAKLMSACRCSQEDRSENGIVWVACRGHSDIEDRDVPFRRIAAGPYIMMKGEVKWPLSASRYRWCASRKLVRGRYHCHVGRDSNSFGVKALRVPATREANCI